MADTYYISAYTGAQMDTADGRSLGPDATPTAGSDNLVTSGGVFDAIQGAAPAVQETASGAAAYITDGSASPVASLIAEIKATQAGSGTPSPSNPRAINGFTGANITAAGKNLVKIATGTTTNQGITFAKADGAVTMSGTCGTSAAWHTVSADNFTLPAGTYTLSGGGDTDKYLSLRTVLDSPSVEIASTRAGNATFTLASDTLLMLRASVRPNVTVNGVTFYPQIEVGSVATAWEVYNATTYPVSWQTEAGTVYGGTLNVTTGVLTVTHILTTFDGSADENWLFNTVDASRNRMSIALPDVKMPPSYSDDYVANWLGPSLASSPQVWLASYTNQGILRVGVPTTIASVSDWQTYLGNDPLGIVYPIATPQTYQLTPTEVDTLLGINNIWADTGDVTVEYRADTALFIEEKVPEAPTTDGTYTLTCTVSGGVATYSWA